jgi:hypothetical protein
MQVRYQAALRPDELQIIAAILQNRQIPGQAHAARRMEKTAAINIRTVPPLTG